jgi:signal transduction histidine kinase
MNLRLRFALLFSLFVFIILMISVTSIYFLYEKFRQDEFYARIKERATQNAQFFFELGNDNLRRKTEMDRTLSFTLTDENIIIYDTSFNVLYINSDTSGSSIFKENLARNGQKIYYQKKGYRESVAFLYRDSKQAAYVIASAYDKFGKRKIDNLKIVLLATLAGGLVLSGLFAFFYVKQIVKPLGELTGQMQRISESSMNARVPVGPNNNELSRIARNFNDMLNRLENAFEMRKSFVQHASHELRTPLTSMLAQTEAALTKELTPAEIKFVLQSLREDQQHMIELTNSLLLLSKYEKLTSLTDLVQVRVDEVLYEAIDAVKPIYPNCHIAVNFLSVPENGTMLTVMGNDVLLKSAMQNLVTNACHYSEDGDVSINIDAQVNGIKINFDNNGKQLSNEERQRLFIPFFRGQNSMNKKGYGLGLSIVQRIISLHRGSVYYTAVNHRLNRFSVSFPPAQA